MASLLPMKTLAICGETGTDHPSVPAILVVFASGCFDHSSSAVFSRCVKLQSICDMRTRDLNS